MAHKPQILNAHSTWPCLNEKKKCPPPPPKKKTKTTKNTPTNKPKTLPTNPTALSFTALLGTILTQLVKVCLFVSLYQESISKSSTTLRYTTIPLILTYVFGQVWSSFTVYRHMKKASSSGGGLQNMHDNITKCNTKVKSRQLWILRSTIKTNTQKTNEPTKKKEKKNENPAKHMRGNL